jgi:hypothetical protein
VRWCPKGVSVTTLDRRPKRGNRALHTIRPVLMVGSPSFLLWLSARTVTRSLRPMLLRLRRLGHAPAVQPQERAVLAFLEGTSGGSSAGDTPILQRMPSPLEGRPRVGTNRSGRHCRRPLLGTAEVETAQRQRLTAPFATNPTESASKATVAQIRAIAASPW